MKIQIVIILIFSFFFTISCQTTRDQSDLQEQQEGVEEAAELISGDDEDRTS